MSGDPFDDLEGPSPNGHRSVDLAYHEGRVIRVDATDQDRRLIEAIDELTPEALADAAVLCRSLREVDRYHRLLSRAGIPVLRLENYDGRPVRSVKLGTYRRAKGLEFKYVFLPYYDAALRSSASTTVDEEHAELARRQLFVAMTRARDVLWLGASRI